MQLKRPILFYCSWDAAHSCALPTLSTVRCTSLLPLTIPWKLLGGLALHVHSVQHNCREGSLTLLQNPYLQVALSSPFTSIHAWLSQTDPICPNMARPQIYLTEALRLHCNHLPSGGTYIIMYVHKYRAYSSVYVYA